MIGDYVALGLTIGAFLVLGWLYWQSYKFGKETDAMSCTAATAKRRRRQAKNGYAHMDPMTRPRYHKTNADKSLEHLQQVIERERRMNAGKKKT